MVINLTATKLRYLENFRRKRNIMKITLKFESSVYDSSSFHGGDEIRSVC